MSSQWYCKDVKREDEIEIFILKIFIEWNRICDIWGSEGDRCSSAGKATELRSVGSRFEFRSRQEVLSSPHPSRPVLGATQPPVLWTRELFLEGKSAETWRWTPIPSSVDVKERVELYYYFRSVLTLSCDEKTFTFTFSWGSKSGNDEESSPLVYDAVFVRMFT